MNTDPDDPAATSAYAQNTFSGPSTITASTIVITSDWDSSNTAFDSYTQQTYIHEVGHALGLGHAGPYNGTADYGTDNIYTNDNWAYTVMSYFDQNEAGHGSYRFVLGLQQADIVAIQQLYGARPAGTFAGNTTFGFNSSAPGTNIDWSQFVLTQAGVTYLRPPSMTIYDTGGVDTINLSGFAQPQILDLRPGTFSSLGDRPGQTPVHYVNAVSIAANTIIENAIGGSGSDTITGNSANNTITLGAGADTFVYAPGGGADTITDFAVSVDRIDLTAFSSFAANAAFNGRTSSGGGTLLTFGAGQTILLQGVSTGQLTLANLLITGSPPPPPPPPGPTEGRDILSGTYADDVINALGGNDSVFGNAGADTLIGGLGSDLLAGGPGNDTLHGDTGNDTLYGQDGADRLEGGAENDLLAGGNGSDTLFGGTGNDILRGDAGNDFLYGEDGIDRLEGGAENDLLAGGNGSDTLLGGTGSDTLLGDADNDVLYGEDGDDWLEGGGENDLLAGGSGSDMLLGGTGNDTLRGGADNDTLYGEDGYDRLEGGDGNDVLAGGVGNDTLFGGAGDDQLGGGDGNDLLFGEAGNDTLFGGAGADNVNGGLDNDLLAGGAGNDTLRGDAGNDTLYGEDGDDRLEGGDGDNLLYGGNGADLLIGGAGNDTLYGNAGNDTFVFSDFVTGTIDTIADMLIGSDKIQLTNSGFADFAALQAAMTTSAGVHTVITFATGAQLQISNVLPGELQASDFEFITSAEPQDGKAQVGEAGAPDIETTTNTFDFSRLPEIAEIPVMNGGGGGDARSAGAVSVADIGLTDGLTDMFDLDADHFTLDRPDGIDWQGA